jgi:hypothetical protein
MVALSATSSETRDTVDDLREQVATGDRLDAEDEVRADAAPGARFRDTAQVCVDLFLMELVDRMAPELVDHRGEHRYEHQENDESGPRQTDLVPLEAGPSDLTERATFDGLRRYTGRL